MPLLHRVWPRAVTKSGPGRVGSDSSRLVIQSARTWRFSNPDLALEIMLVLGRDENAIIRHKLDHLTLETGQPILTRIIRQGVDEGVFAVDDPDVAAEAILLLSIGIADRLAHALAAYRVGEPAARDQVADDVLRRINGFHALTERMVGAPERSLGRVGLELIDRMAAALGRRDAARGDAR